MKALLLLFLVPFVLSGVASCASRSVLTRTQFAFLFLYDRAIICARAVREPCGLTLSDCSGGFPIECATDVIVIDLESGAPPPLPRSVPDEEGI